MEETGWRKKIGPVDCPLACSHSPIAFVHTHTNTHTLTYTIRSHGWNGSVNRDGNRKDHTEEGMEIAH